MPRERCSLACLFVGAQKSGTETVAMWHSSVFLYYVKFLHIGSSYQRYSEHIVRKRATRTLHTDAIRVCRDLPVSSVNPERLGRRASAHRCLRSVIGIASTPRFPAPARDAAHRVL